MNDKLKHFCAGIAAGVITALPCYCDTGSLFAGIWAALFSAACAGGAKEFADNQHGCPFDLNDFAWTCAGGVAVALFVFMLHFGKG